MRHNHAIMLKAQQFVLNLLSALLLVGVFALIVQNMHASAPLDVLGWHLDAQPVGVAMAVSGVLMAASLMLRMGARMLAMGRQNKQASRELERKEVSREEAAEKVKVLEAKVQTLEKALSEALKQTQP